MKSLRYGFVALFTAFYACTPASETPPAAAPTAPSEPPAPPPPPPAPPAPKEPTAEEKKKAEEQQKLLADLERQKQEQAAELARLTPEIRAEAKALAEKTYWSTRAAITAALAGKHRRPGNAVRDSQRHPLQTLEFFGLKPTHTVLEYGPGEGWYTELLAPTLASKGKLYVTLANPEGPTDQRSTYYGRQVRGFLDKLPEAYGKVERVVTSNDTPKLNLDGTLDMILAIRTLHGMHNNKQLVPWLTEFNRALKPKGVLGVVQHRAPAGADPDTSSKRGYLPEAWVIQQVEAAGFKLAGKSEINANPKDTKDHPDGVWALPPTLSGGDKDREKYLAIGESDRMTLKFIKP